ncbi:hypothetical protein D2T29_19750 [Sinirhodobacter populi]|uniref:Uncharacterized protein n=1 Tax=Paenirhodobacter populi TaxID=2306993 RepID=A0A443K242_9RHOB|nr:hypothetical protein [Sinirhodobacter populi]RWR26814.1 hypothetical protein D2T29_19750 [Sinirhodobacter populi]
MASDITPEQTPVELVAEIRKLLSAAESRVMQAVEVDALADQALAEGLSNGALRRQSDSLWDQIRDIDILIVDRLSFAEARGMLAEWQAHLAPVGEAVAG